MPFPVQHRSTPDNEGTSETYPALLHLLRPLLEYRIIMAITRGDVGAVTILNDALRMSKELSIDQILLALGPTTPHSLQPPERSRVLWATFTDGAHLFNGPRLTIVPPNHLTDLSLNLDKLSRTRIGRIPLIIGDFLDNVLSVSTASPSLYAFLCKLFTRIRQNEQTAFLLATEDMHELKKIAVLRRFADVVIQYSSTQDDGDYRIQARVLDHIQNHHASWKNAEPLTEHRLEGEMQDRMSKIGRPFDLSRRGLLRDVQQKETLAQFTSNAVRKLS